MTDVITLHKPEPASKPAFCLTPTAQAIMDLLASCEAHGFLGVVVGEPGTGKSTAVGEYVAKRQTATTCRMTRATSALQPALVRICQEIGGEAPKNAGAYQLHDAALLSLSTWGTRLLIIDEAQYLSDDALEGVRDLYDAARLGVVLVGNVQLSSRWSDSRNKTKHNQFSQLRARIGQQLVLERPLPDDVKALCEHLGVPGAGRDIVERAARLPGQLHKVATLLRVARELGGGTVTRRALQDAADMAGVTL